MISTHVYSFAPAIKNRSYSYHMDHVTPPLTTNHWKPFNGDQEASETKSLPCAQLKWLTTGGVLGLV